MFFQGEVMSGAQRKTGWRSWWARFRCWSSGEQVWIEHYKYLKEQGPKRAPVVILFDEESWPILVQAAPDEPGGEWLLADGRRVKYEDIQQLDAADVLLGYV